MIFGMDVGRHFDQSPLVGIQDKIISPIHIFVGLDFIAQGAFVKATVGTNPVYLDVTGLGRGFADILVRIYKVRVVPVVIGFGDRCRVHREGLWVGKEYLMNLVSVGLGECRVGPSVNEEVRDEFRNQLANFMVKPGKVTRFEGRSGSHDDLVIAFGLSLLGAMIDGKQKQRPEIPQGRIFVGPRQAGRVA